LAKVGPKPLAVGAAAAALAAAGAEVAGGLALTVSGV